MPLKTIGSPNAKYLAATDILIGDMSDTNYEFLLFDRPIILLVNEWLRTHFPDIGIKTNIHSLSDAITRSIKSPNEYHAARVEWLTKTIYQPDGEASKRVLETSISTSNIRNPHIAIIHGGNDVLKTNLYPLAAFAKDIGIEYSYVAEPTAINDSTVYISAHFAKLNIQNGFKVHLDHGLKGQGTANVEYSKNDYIKNEYFPHINLHITAGQIGQQRTEMLLGPLKDRATVVGYPKSDDLLKFNSPANKQSVCRELGFDKNIPLVTYAPAGAHSTLKPGGSLSDEVLKELKNISQKLNINILIKLKYPQATLYNKITSFISSFTK